ncbi:MAG: hypothetical protein FWD62_12200 [Betaproteobacteria bacterium]|nr:hypothetical protein [Betaproteobacteria bacterium]
MFTANIPDGEDLIGTARFYAERPPLVCDFGQDSVYATETHPEGLRYGETPHAPGTEPHHAPDPNEAAHNEPGVISIG